MLETEEPEADAETEAEGEVVEESPLPECQEPIYFSMKWTHPSCSSSASSLLKGHTRVSFGHKR